jgi:hypothetical protein
MSANLYASVAEFKDRMSIDDTARDLAIDRVLQSASRWIDKATGRRFYTNDTPEVRYYSLESAYWNPSYRWPYADHIRTDDVQTLTELATDANGDGVYETVWTNPTDYHLEPLNALVNGEPYTAIVRTNYSGRFNFPSYAHSIRATGTFGYCTLANVPAGVREATLMVAETMARPIMDLNVPGVQSYKVGSELTVLSMEARMWPPVMRQMLDHYMKQVYVF